MPFSQDSLISPCVSPPLFARVSRRRNKIPPHTASKSSILNPVSILPSRRIPKKFRGISRLSVQVMRICDFSQTQVAARGDARIKKFASSIPIYIHAKTRGRMYLKVYLSTTVRSSGYSSKIGLQSNAFNL